jgi:hypothetical protein
MEAKLPSRQGRGDEGGATDSLNHRQGPSCLTFPCPAGGHCRSGGGPLAGLLACGRLLPFWTPRVVPRLPRLSLQLLGVQTKNRLWVADLQHSSTFSLRTIIRYRLLFIHYNSPSFIRYSFAIIFFFFRAGNGSAGSGSVGS